MFKRSNATIPSTRRITVHRFTETDDFFIMNYERKHTGWVVLLSVLFSICTRQACIGNCNGVRVIVFGVREPDGDTHEAPQVQELEPQPSCSLTGFWMT